MFWLYSILSVVIVIPIISVSGWYVWFHTSKITNLVNRIPGPKPLPFIGNAWDLLGGFEVILDVLVGKWTRAYGTMYRIYVGLRPHIVIASPELMEVVLSNSKLNDKGTYYDYLRPWLGDSLLVSSGDSDRKFVKINVAIVQLNEASISKFNKTFWKRFRSLKTDSASSELDLSGAKWKARRRLLLPVFHFRVLESFMGTFNEHSAVLCRKLQNLCRESHEVDIFPLLDACALDIICETGLGCKLNSQSERSEYTQAVYRISQIVSERFRRPWLRPKWLFALTPLGREHARCLKVLHKFTNNVVRRKRAMFEEAMRDKVMVSLGIKPRQVFLDYILEAATAGAQLTDQDIRDEVEIILYGGNDTTASAASWFLYCMACNPDHQDNARAELYEIFGHYDRPCTPEDIPRMQYLDRCIKETMRLYPPDSFIVRGTREPVNIGGYEVPAGCDLMLFIYALHHNEEVFPDPEVFKPERFTAEQNSARHRFAYLPFSAGPRDCIGKKYAIIELKIVLSTLLRRFEFKVPPGAQNPKPTHQVTLKPHGGIQLLVFDRSRSS